MKWAGKVAADLKTVAGVGWRLVGALLLLGAASAFAQVAAAGSFRSPSETSAARPANAARAPLLAMAQAGRRLVAVGLRGRIVFSDDAGKTWVQAQVPVEVDLVAVSFPTPTEGWAVGHRGVVLSTSDAGGTWVRRFGDQQLNEQALSYYRAQKAAPETAMGRALANTARAISESAVPSLLDVWFESATAGTIVGTFNTIFRTEDGGKTWTPSMHKADNPEGLHFYAVRGGADGLYAAGEKGGVWRFDAETKTWVAAPTGYAGTLFGLVVDGPKVLAYGMRGSVYASEDAGRHWSVVATQRKAGFVAGLRLSNGEVLLADQSGELLRSKDAGRSFAAVDGKLRVMAFSMVQQADGQLFAAGPSGVTAFAAPAQ